MVVWWAVIFHLFFFFIAYFLLVKNTYKNPYSLKAVNRIPAMVSLAALYFGLYYFEGHILIKNWT
jgi:hypothetical protein